MSGIAIAPRSPVRSPVRSPINLYSGIPIANQTIVFGADTLASAGGAKAVDLNGNEVDFVSVTNQGGATRTWSVSSGRLIANGTPGVDNGVVLTCSTTLGTISVTISTLANTYSVATDAEYAAVCAISVATLSGKTMQMRTGTYGWTEADLNSKSFTSTFTIKGDAGRAAPRFVFSTNKVWVAARNVKFDGVDFYPLFLFGTSDANQAALRLDSSVENLTFIRCTMDGGYQGIIDTYGSPGYVSEYGWRGLVSCTTADVTGELRFEDCLIRGGRRGLNIGVDEGSGKIVVKGCRFEQNAVDALYISGKLRYGTDVLFNEFSGGLSVNNQQFLATVNPATDTMTINTERFGPVGSAVVNIGSQTTTVPGGLNLPGVGGANDYQCTITSVGSGVTTVSFPVNITSAGSNVYIVREPSHADFIQFAVNNFGDALQVNGKDLNIIGNVIYGSLGNDGSWSQCLFMENISTSVTDYYYENVRIAGNIVYTQNPIGLWLYNGLNSFVCDNTVVAPSGAGSGERGTIRIQQQWATVGSGSYMFNNASDAITSAFSDEISTENHTLAPSAYSGSGIFSSFSAAPTSVAELKTFFARNDILGTLDYVNKVYDLPSINTATFPDFTDATNQVVNALVTSAPVQITNVLKPDGTSSSQGALVEVTGTGSPQVRVTSDVGGSTVVTDWTSSPTKIASNHYLWVRLTASPNSSTARTATVRVGNVKQTWSVTTAAAVPPSVLAYVQSKLDSFPGTGATSTKDFVMPTGITELNTLVMFIRHGATGTTSISSAPSGWTVVGSDTTGGAGLYVYKKTAANSDSGATQTWTFGGASNAVMALYEIAAPSGQVEAAFVDASNDPPDSGAVTGGSADTVWLAFSSVRRNDNAVSAGPSGYSGFLQGETSTTNSTSGASVTGGAAYKQSTAASENPGPFTWTGTTSTGARAATVSVR